MTAGCSGTALPRSHRRETAPRLRAAACERVSFSVACANEECLGTSVPSDTQACSLIHRALRWVIESFSSVDWVSPARSLKRRCGSRACRTQRGHRGRGDPNRWDMSSTSLDGFLLRSQEPASVQSTRVDDEGRARAPRADSPHMLTTRLPVSDQQLGAVLQPVGVPVEFEPLSGGMFASAHRVVLSDGRCVVVKVTATDPSRLCRYERGIARTEARVYSTLSARGLPVPRVVLTDFTHGIIDGDVVVTELLSGRPWNDLALGEEDERGVRRRLGAMMARLHVVRAPAFGYPAVESGLQADGWRAAFRVMVEALLQDAAASGTALPEERILAALHAQAAALDSVVDPVYVHTDLWPGNVFLDDDGEICGIIDTERTVWGDPLLELVGADQLGLWDVDADVLAGNVDAGGVLATALSSPHGPTRFALCRLYMTLVLLIEINVRGYEGAWLPAHRIRVREMLEASLDRLAA